jgi:hypothetical protein
MIFQATWQQVMDGTKTETRRLVKPEHRPIMEGNQVVEVHVIQPPHRLSGIYRERLLWQVGHTYAVQPGRGQKAVARIRLTGIRRERLQDITPEQAYNEGMVHFAAPHIPLTLIFARVWDSLHDRPGERFEDNPDVWVLVFEKVA